MRQNFNQNQGQPQFNQNYNGNQGSQQQQPRMQQGQQFQNNGNAQHQRDNISQGNEWDSFFQSSGVPINNNGGNLRGNNQFNGGNQRDNMYDPVQNNSVVNDLAANQLLRGAFQQNNSSGIDQSMKQSLAKTMGLLGTPNLNSAVVQQRMALQNGGGGGGNLMQGRANNPINNMNNNVGGNNGMNNNIGGNNGMIPGSYNSRNAGGNQNNNFGSSQGGRNMGGDGNNFNNLQQGRPQQNFNNNNNVGGYDDDSSYEPYPVNNNGGMRGSGGAGNYNNNGNVGNRVGGNLSGNSSFQHGGGNQRFNSMGGNNNGSYDEYEPSSQGQSSAPYNSNVPDPLSVLNKLNNIVAVTGGGLSAAQLQRAIQNPAGISHANPQQLLGITSGGPQRFPVSGGVPQRNLNAPMNNNLGGNLGLNRPVNNLGGNLNINANPIRNNAGVEVLPGDVRYRGNAPGGNTAGGNSSFGGPQGIRQVQLGGGGGQNNYQGNNISGSGGVRNLGGGGAGGGQWSSLGGAAGVNSNNLNSNVRDNFNNSNNNSFSQQRGSNQQSFDNNIGNGSGNNSIASNNRSASKWSAGSENPLDALFASGGGNNAGGAPRNLNTHNSAVPSAANGPIRKIAKGGFPGTSNYPTNPNVNVMLHSFSGNKRDRSNSSSRSRSPPARRDFRDDHHNNNNSNYNNSRDSDYNQGGRGSGGRGRGGGRGDLDSGRGRGFGGRNSTRSPPRNNARGPVNNSNNAGPLSPGPSSHSGGQGGRKEVDYVNLPPHALVEDFNIPAIPKNLHTITSVDLYTKFPNLYVPADFISVEVDWKSITASLYSDKICDITNSVPIVFENLPSALQPSAVTAGVTEAPKYTYLGANTVNNTITNNYTHYSHNHIQTQRPVKFNAKVIISCGMANSGDRIDHLLPRKLRVLCGRRKGQVMLLGSSWCAELDGGNPLEDRSCLLNTARRAVYAQSLLDIYNPTPVSTTVDEFGNAVPQEQQEQCFDVTSNLTKLCEINYHRPKEEINNKLYPEQEEITAIYLYTIQPDSLPLGLQGLDSAWEIFSGRVKGENAGPLMNLNVDQFHEERLHTAQQIAAVDGQEAGQQEASEDSAQVAEAKDQQQEIKSEETADTISAFVGETTANPSEEVAMQVDASAASESAESSVEISIDRTRDVAAATASAASAHSSALVAEVKEEAPAVTATANTTVNNAANTTTSSAPATMVVPKTELIKPDAPTIFLCPAPLPKEIFDDNAKRQESVALRMLPLSAILSYSPDDCSERIFEASIAGEFIRSIISVSNANIIVDFLIAENPVLSSLADIRVVQSVKRLREIVAASKAKLSAPAIAVAVAAAGSATATGALDVSAPSSEEAVPVAVTAAAEAEEMDAASTAATAGSEVGAASAITTDSAVVSTDGSDSVQNEVTSESAMAVETSDETAMVGTEAHSTTEDVAAQAQQEESPLVLVSDEEARTWRRRFVAACRWFDADQERVLARDLIQLIIHSSTRNMSRADVSAATDLVCRAGKISYETFV